MDFRKYYKILPNEKISSQEFLYPHGQDKRTYYLNKIIKGIVFDDNRIYESMKVGFGCEIPNTKYFFYVEVPRKYSNSEILWEATYHTVESALVWYDLSDIDNFEIKVSDGGHISKCTYYDLVLWGINRQGSPFGSKIVYSPEKYEKIFDYGQSKFEMEQKEYMEKYHPTKPQEIKKKSVFEKIIDWWV